MTQQESHSAPQDDREVSRAAGMAFEQRPASQNWEVVTLPTSPPLQLWAWFKPAQTPNAVMLQVPPAGNVPPTGFTIRQTLHAVGVDPAAVSACQLFGFWFPGEGGHSAHFDQIVSGPAPGGDPGIVVYVDVAGNPAAVPPRAGGAPDDGTGHQPLDDQSRELFRSFERDWKAARNSERQLTGLQKQLTDMQQRLSTMNRDLTGDEALYADRADLEDWRDARRFLRESSQRLGKCIKEFVAGETTYAGKREWFQQIYENYVTTQTPFSGMAEARSEFEYYRRTIQNLCDRMQAACHHAQHEGITKAQNVLSRIAVKVSAKKAKGR